MNNAIHNDDGGTLDRGSQTLQNVRSWSAIEKKESGMKRSDLCSLKNHPTVVANKNLQVNR